MGFKGQRAILHARGGEPGDEANLDVHVCNYQSIYMYHMSALWKRFFEGVVKNFIIE